MIPGASLPSWRKPGQGGGIPGGMSASESGLEQPFLGPWRWGRACLSGSGPGLECSFAYLHVCRFHLLTLAGLGKTPVQKVRQDPSPCGWLPDGAPTQNLGSYFRDPSSPEPNTWLFPWAPLVEQARNFSHSGSYPFLLHSLSPLGGDLEATFLFASFLQLPRGFSPHCTAGASSSILCHLTPFPHSIRVPLGSPSASIRVPLSHHSRSWEKIEPLRSAQPPWLPLPSYLAAR